ncbi:MAG: hypothetical protein P4M00_20565 [Azospirillaceae bacterium]|nr:hypothetical protein [Azospirillaceae bacterium]
MTREYQIGDQVTVISSQNGPQIIATVARFTNERQCMVLSDGSQWRADGRRQWRFRGSHYTGPFLEPTRPEDVEIVAKRRAIGALRKWTAGLTLESAIDAGALRRILDLVEHETSLTAPAETPEPEVAAPPRPRLGLVPE